MLVGKITGPLLKETDIQISEAKGPPCSPFEQMSKKTNGSKVYVREWNCIVVQLSVLVDTDCG
jgi:hypothetical protein